MPDRQRPVSRSRYPGYDVLSKWGGPSWNDKTREVIARRLATPTQPRFFTAAEFEAVRVLARLVVPAMPERPAIPVAALVDARLWDGMGDGFRPPGLPRPREAWRLGLKALDAEAQTIGADFVALPPDEQERILRRASRGELTSAAWGSMRARDFFTHRLLRDLVHACYAHPGSWSAIGWGGPASPRGYVRLDANVHDPWEAAEADAGEERRIAAINRHVR